MIKFLTLLLCVPLCRLYGMENGIEQYEGKKIVAYYTLKTRSAPNEERFWWVFDFKILKKQGIYFMRSNHKKIPIHIEANEPIGHVFNNIKNYLYTREQMPENAELVALEYIDPSEPIKSLHPIWKRVPLHWSFPRIHPTQ